MAEKVERLRRMRSAAHAGHGAGSSGGLVALVNPDSMHVHRAGAVSVSRDPNT